MKKSKWIWYPGDFELYHSTLLHNRRRTGNTYKNLNTDKVETVSAYHYPMWRVDGPRRNVSLYKYAEITEKETVEFFANTDTATMSVNGKYYKRGAKAELSPGKYKITLEGFKDGGFPCFFCKGETFATDESWVVEDFDKRGAKAGCNEFYSNEADNPEIFKFSYKKLYPVAEKKIENGKLYDFGKETFGKIILENVSESYCEIFVSLGETEEEATDITEAVVVLNAKVENGKYESETSALRYAFVPDTNIKYDISLDYEYLDIDDTASFKCNDELINKLWDVCAYTLHLNMREAFFDGIKRDRWVWSGDAYQSYFVNYYLTKDKDTVKRTIRMLRGRDPLIQHTNTIVDYSFYWICSIWDYYYFTKDREFVSEIYPDMLSMMKFIEGRLDKDGMYTTRNGDWVFIDWSAFDPKEGPLCAEQMLLSRAYAAMSSCAELLCDTVTAVRCKERAEYVKDRVNKLYWDNDKGAFVDDYTSGRRNVTRHANIFALLYDLTDEDRKKSIIENVIYNKDITPITTPYFEYYELDAMCTIGDFKYVTDMLNSYWGSMLRLGATSIWEEFDPTKNGVEHYSMYGDKYGKSLCHAWGASPIYLLGKYALGVRPTSAGYETFDVVPNLMGFEFIDGKVPVLDGEVSVFMNDNEINVLTDKDGGTLVYNGKRYEIEKNKELKISRI